VIKVHSFDVFDTVLIRRAAVPSDIFRHVARRIVRESPIAPPRGFVEDFVHARIEAERVSLASREETTLADIWRVLHQMLPGLPETFGPECELEAEHEALVPNGPTACDMARLRAAGARIVFASDTYLPADFVWHQLHRYGIAEPGDGLYVSSAFGHTKKSGALFRSILASEGIAAHGLHHHGDNRISDVLVPRALGIATTLVTSSRLTAWERALLSTPDSLRDTASRLAGAMRAARLAQRQPDRIASLTATFLGPATLMWAAWVLGAAQQNGIRRLYFVARDCYLAWRVARLLTPLFGNIDCRYLKVSRQAVLLPAIEHVSPSGIPWLHRPWEQPTLERILSKLGLSWNEVADDFSALAGKKGSFTLIRTRDQWHTFWNILSGARVGALITQRIQRHRATTCAYLRAAGLFEPEPAAIVDIGWRLTTQRALRALLRTEQRDPTLSGYYLGLQIDRSSQSDAGVSTALFYASAPDRRAIALEYEIFRRATILEHLLGLAPHGTVHAYRNNGSAVEPVSAPVAGPYVDMVEAIAAAVESFCRTQLCNATRFADEPTAQVLLDQLFTSWCERPDPHSLELLCSVPASADHNNIGARPLVEPWRLKHVGLSLIPPRVQRLLGLSSAMPIWPEAARLYQPGMLARLMAPFTIDDAATAR
jgi:FMN phosphatase YigB (HAD superfamily)